MNTRTKITMNNDSIQQKNYYSVSVTCANEESFHSLADYVLANTYNVLDGCPCEDEEGFYDTFSGDGESKKDFMKEMRRVIKEWKATVK